MPPPRPDTPSGGGGGWPKPLTPSTELRRWYHDGGDFPTFRSRYLAELSTPEAQAELSSLRALLSAGPVILLTASKDLDHSHAAVLRELLTEAAPPARDDGRDH
ncbi:DUF488 domain-containing protein [Kitasatospora sp. P5_F3]